MKSYIFAKIVAILLVLQSVLLGGGASLDLSGRGSTTYFFKEFSIKCPDDWKSLDRYEIRELFPDRAPILSVSSRPRPPAATLNIFLIKSVFPITQESLKNTFRESGFKMSDVLRGHLMESEKDISEIFRKNGVKTIGEPSVELATIDGKIAFKSVSIRQPNGSADQVEIIVYQIPIGRMMLMIEQSVFLQRKENYKEDIQKIIESIKIFGPVN